MRAILAARTRRGRSALTADSWCCSGDARDRRFDRPLLPARALATTAGARVGVRKRMMPLIKLVHPDMFAQYPPNVATTNSKSLKDLNTLIDAAEALEAAASGAGARSTNGGVGSLASAPTVDPFYLLKFFHHPTPRPQRQGPASAGSSSENDDTGSSSELMELRAELRFPPALSQDPSGSLRGQLRRQLDGLLKRVSVAEEEADGPGLRGAAERQDEARDAWERLAMEEGVRVREGETMEDFYGGAYSGGGGGRGRRRGAPPRDGIRMERESKTTDRDQGDQPRMSSEELRKMTIEHAGDAHHVNPWDSGAGSGFLGGGLGLGGKASRRFGGAEAAAQAKSRRGEKVDDGVSADTADPAGVSGKATAPSQRRSRVVSRTKSAAKVDDLLRSGRVQFAGVPLAREAAALLRLHQTLVKHFEHLELHDRGLWSTVILVLRARSDSYEVQVHSGGPVLVIPEKFSERNLIRFLSEVLLSYI